MMLKKGCSSGLIWLVNNFSTAPVLYLKGGREILWRTTNETFSSGSRGLKLGEWVWRAFSQRPFCQMFFEGEFMVSDGLSGEENIRLGRWQAWWTCFRLYCRPTRSQTKNPTMLKKLLKWLAVFLTAFAAVVAALLFVPKNNGKPYRITVAKNQGISSVSRKLAQDGIVYNRYVLVAAAYVMGVHNQLNAGSYRLSAKVSAWDILKRIKKGRPDSVSVQILEGARFAQMRRIIDNTADIAHDTRGWSDEKLMAEVAPDALSSNPEGQFFPDSYEIDAGGSDLQIYKIAYRKMRENLQEAWDDRQSGLPYKNPYEMLIMASLIEKETAHEDDRAHVAAVFVNRLNIGMRLQTDPTVIYGMGDAYKGRIRKADLQRDTPYNTYTRSGLTPTPIALPGKAALEAAGHPSDEKYLYFVSKMDGTGLSEFSHNLSEHNAAVRKYILKK